MATPLHPHAVWNPAFRPNTTTSLPPIVSIATNTNTTTTTTKTPASHPSNTHLHNVTPFAAAAAAKLGADTDLKSVPLGDSRDLELGMLTTKKMGVMAKVEGWWRWFACMLLMLLSVSLGTCFVFGS